MKNTCQRGATLIEVLVTVFILAVGLLGLAGLQSTSIKSNQGAYYRSQATLLAGDMADRMRANRTAALAGSYNISSFPSSSTTNNTANAVRAEKDKAEWLNSLASLLPDGTGKIEYSNKIFVISIKWNDNRARIRSSSAQDTNQDFIFTYRTQL
ncbi:MULTISPECIES: type IV pilus modification protein PilV [Pseudomonas]|uniref:Type IV pilus modification protein PilV n=1 Tax=Pseudomonas luteola TaxID=47886 RepID=A0A2X2CAE3_PSELU|nr:MULTISPECIES: type IV pilus modification protein PilV [Pseudomonas]ENA33280.1 type IV pilus modification protein PilV [Pseudomonas sp. HPB0071]MBF8639503.1 type IV pilus modification protein PilV [Pseudomonas zeshuii]RRW51309.1 type IV pilus modification protein PilV [Pseudomonas luteola]SHI56242.1 type IV pilus assembly protein PilV [Pseudomonas zeshuii]SPZ02696.1 type IV pilus modification protein PilV [Pseudomonas luteola]